MAYRIENILEGYDECRFQGEVREDLLCSICLKVLNDPKTCQNKEHTFCTRCITEHLRRSSTCPECREHLTPQTLKNPPRFLLNTLSDLKINCEYNDRGCPDYVRLENLQDHVHRCGYSPVMCGNEGCGMEVNKRDKESHEKNLCQFKIIKYLKARQDEMKNAQDEMKQKLNETIVKINAMERKQGQIDNKVSKIKENIEGMKQTQAEMKRKFEEISLMIMQLLQENNNGVPVTPVINQDIIIIGGRYGSLRVNVLNTVEKFNVVEGKSTQLPSMNQPRAASASCVYNNDIIVAGGYDGQAGTNTIEMLKMKQHPLAWTPFDSKLPVRLSGHAVVLYQKKLFIIGGYDWNEKKLSDAVFEVRLIPPYTSMLLNRIRQAIKDHCAEVVNNKLFILGGMTSVYSRDATDNVVHYDAVTNEFKPCTSLPRAVFGMSTVTWGNMIIVVGGKDKNDQVLNDVIMYDTMSGQSKKLPSMIYKRYGSSAVIMNDVIVVMGGRNDEQGILNSVETFTVGSDGWKELPGMMENRHFGTAIVIPGN